MDITVAVADVSNSGLTVGPLDASRLSWRVFIEVVAPRADQPDPVLATPSDPRVTPTAHSTYAVHERMLRKVGAASIHVEEDPAEAAWLMHGDGPFAEILTPGPGRKRSVFLLDELGLLRPGTLLVHMTCADDDSLRLAAQRGTVVVLCPQSNVHIGGRLPDWRAVRQAGCQVALGTDSLASCASLDVLTDVAMLARDGADPDWLLDAAGAGGSTRLGFGPPAGWIAIGDHAATLTDPVRWVAFEGKDAPVTRLAWQAS